MDRHCFRNPADTFLKNFYIFIKLEGAEFSGEIIFFKGGSGKNVEKLDEKVEVLEHKPAKRWDSIVDKIIMTIVGGIVGYALVKIGL